MAAEREAAAERARADALYSALLMFSKERGRDGGGDGSGGNGGSAGESDGGGGGAACGREGA
eukprot:5113449-Prymnesium_polylepis.1